MKDPTLYASIVTHHIMTPNSSRSPEPTIINILLLYISIQHLHNKTAPSKLLFFFKPWIPWFWVQTSFLGEGGGGRHCSAGRVSSCINFEKSWAELYDLWSSFKYSFTLMCGGWGAWMWCSSRWQKCYIFRASGCGWTQSYGVVVARVRHFPLYR